MIALVQHVSSVMPKEKQLRKPMPQALARAVVRI
jgi:hypothetical protein